MTPPEGPHLVARPAAQPVLARSQCGLGGVPLRRVSLVSRVRWCGGFTEEAGEKKARQHVEELQRREEEGAAEEGADVRGERGVEIVRDREVDLRELGLRIDRLAAEDGVEEPVRQGGTFTRSGRICTTNHVTNPLGRFIGRSNLQIDSSAPPIESAFSGG